MFLPSFSPRSVRFVESRVRKRRITWRGERPPPDSNPFSDAEFGKNSPTRQAQSPQARTARSSSKNAVSFSFARTTKRFPSPRCASTIEIVRPLESIAETQPRLKPALLSFVSDDFPILHGCHCILPPLFSTRQ